MHILYQIVSVITGILKTVYAGQYFCENHDFFQNSLMNRNSTQEQLLFKRKIFGNIINVFNVNFDQLIWFMLKY